MGKKVTVEILQVDGLTLVGKADSGHWVVFDADESHGGHNAAIRPFETFLVSLAACTAMDVISILKKMRIPLKRLAVRLEAEREDDHPKVPKYIKLNYTISVDSPDAVDISKVKRAITLSQDKYCSVSAVVRMAGIKVDWDFEVTE